MDQGTSPIDHFRPRQEEFVDHAGDRSLVAGDRSGGDDHGVTLTQSHVAKLAVREAAEGGHRLPLRTGEDIDDAIVREHRGIAGLDEGALWIGEIPEFLGNAHVVLEAAPHRGDKAPVLRCRVDHLLDARDERGEGGDENAAVDLAEDFVIRLTDHPLRGRVTSRLDVHAIGHQQSDAALTIGREFGEVGLVPVDGRLVELEVTGEHHQTRRGGDCEPDGIRNAVTDTERLNGEHACRDRIDRVRVELAEVDILQLGLVEFHRDQADREFGRPNGDRQQIGQEIGNRSDVILVAMGDEDPADAVLVLFEIRDIREYEIDARLIFLGEGQPAIDDDDVVAVLEKEDVLADLGHTTEKDQPDSGRFRHRCLAFG